MNASPRQNRSPLESATLALILSASLLTGCARPIVQSPLTQSMPGSDPDHQLEFWHQLADRPVTCNDEAFHGLLMYIDGEDTSADYAARVAALKSRRLLPAGFNQPADRAVDRGTLAVAVSKHLKVRGGVMQRLAPDCSRYALRELVYLNVFPPASSPNQTFTGSEFLGIVGRVEDYERTVAAGKDTQSELTPTTQPTN